MLFIQTDNLMFYSNVNFQLRRMPSSLLKNHSRSTSHDCKIFYKSDQMRFKGLDTNGYKKFPRNQYVFQTSPWVCVDNQQIEVLVDRLEDKPEHLYHTIEQKHKKGKFTLLKSASQKQNLRLIQDLQCKKQHYEQQFKAILRNRKSQILTIILPKLEGLGYVYGDHFHGVESKKLSKKIYLP